MNEESKDNANMIKAILLNSLHPYIVALVGTVINIVASFIKYITISGWFYSRKASIVQLIIESIEKPGVNLKTAGDKVVFGIVLAGVLFSLLALLTALSKKMKSTIVFAILASLPFLLFGNAWIHYIGIIIAIIGAIWYMVVKKIKPDSE